MKHQIKAEDFKDYRITHSIASSVGISENKTLNVVVRNDRLSYEVVSHGEVVAASYKLSGVIEAYNAI